MPPSAPHFRLHIETGERAGEEVPIPPDGLLVGRRPECGLHLVDGSVSGRHARVEVDGGRVRVRDLGSTNGTRVGGERVEEAALAHGDAVAFGQVRCALVDGRLVEPVADRAGEAVAAIDPARLAQGRRRPGVLALALLAALVLVAGVAAWRLVPRGGGSGPRRGTPPPVAVPGNLIPDPSFEEDGALAWDEAEGSEGLLARGGAWSATGDAGLGGELLPGARARLSAPEVELRRRRAHRLDAALAAEGGAAASVGVELATANGGAPPFVAFAAPARGGATLAFEPVSLVLPDLPGYDRARVVLDALARDSAGAVALDDVALAPADDAPGPAARFEEAEAWLLGAPPRTAAVTRAGRVLLAGILVREAADDAPRWPSATLGVDATGSGLRFRVDGAPDDAELVLLADVGASGGESDGRGWIATVGPEGFRSYAADVRAATATSLLLGRGFDLVRLGFDRPVRVTVAPAGGGLRATVGLAGAEAFDVQLSFHAELAAARGLAERAEAAARRGEVGRALASWTELLDEHPFEVALVERASAERARLLQEGLERVAAVRDELERARFFGLADLLERVRGRALDLAETYAGTDVAAAAVALAAEVDAELAGVRAARSSEREARLRAVLGAAEAQGWDMVAGTIRDALDGAAAGEGASER